MAEAGLGKDLVNVCIVERVGHLQCRDGCGYMCIVSWLGLAQLSYYT